MEQGRQFLAAIESTTTWTIGRGMLDLHRADCEGVLLADKGVTRAQNPPASRMPTYGAGS
jgi:hypothetical protein